MICFANCYWLNMAKKDTKNVLLVSSAGTGYQYVAKKPTKGLKANNKLEFRKYDPIVRKHVVFNEAKLVYKAN